MNIHEKTGLVVPVCNSGALAGAINRLLSDDELRRTLGETAAGRVKAEFSREKMLSSYAELYRNILFE